MPDLALPERLARVREVVAGAQRDAGLTHVVRIVAVTKTHGPDAVRLASAAGLDAVGENKVQEALDKQAACAGIPVEWHLIGSLQRNKARHAVGRFALIHAVDRIDLAQELDRRVAPGARQAVLVQVNCSAEPQKSGVEPGGLAALLDGMRGCGRLDLRGLMTMAALDAPEAEQRRTFAALRSLRDAMAREGHELPELSMGMSDDFPAAVREGATLLRLGTVLFGSRTYHG
jgi:pyridoxal phosphate enzyme (YggS family)